jgi:hypothetical protein
MTALASIYAIRVADADLWGHLRDGRLLLEHGGRIPEDPFAYTTADRTWNNHESLTQVLLALAWNHGGAVGLIVLKCVVGAGVLMCLYSCLRLGLSDARLWAPLLMLTSVALGRWFLFRPQLFTFLLLGIYVRILFGHLLGRRAPLWVLPLLMPLWASLHAGFMAGLGVLVLGTGLRILQGINQRGFISILSAHNAPLVLTSLACLVGTFLNPLGWRLWSYAVTELSFKGNRQYIQEWVPLSFEGPHLWTALLVVVPLGILVVSGILAQMRGQRIADLAAWQWLLASAPLAIMTFTSNRHAPVLILWLAPVLGLLIAAAARGREGQPVWILGVGVLWALAAVPAMLMISLVAADPRPRIAVPDEARAPPGLVAFVHSHDVHGNLYAPLWWGSSLTWEAYPEVRVALDGRNVTLFAPSDVTANLVFYHEAGADIDIPRRYRTDYLAMPTDSPMLEPIRRDNHWVPVFEDAAVVLFIRADADDADLIRHHRKDTKPPQDR